MVMVYEDLVSRSLISNLYLRTNGPCALYFVNLRHILSSYFMVIVLKPNWLYVYIILVNATRASCAHHHWPKPVSNTPPNSIFNFIWFEVLQILFVCFRKFNLTCKGTKTAKIYSPYSFNFRSGYWTFCNGWWI